MIRIHRRPEITRELCVRIAKVKIRHAVAGEPAVQIFTVDGFVIGDARGGQAQAETKIRPPRYHAIHAGELILPTG